MSATGSLEALLVRAGRMGWVRPRVAALELESGDAALAVKALLALGNVIWQAYLLDS
jgi:hypothetical protein